MLLILWEYNETIHVILIYLSVCMYPIKLLVRWKAEKYQQKRRYWQKCDIFEVSKPLKELINISKTAISAKV